MTDFPKTALQIETAALIRRLAPNTPEWVLDMVLWAMENDPGLLAEMGLAIAIAQTIAAPEPSLLAVHPAAEAQRQPPEVPQDVIERLERMTWGGEA